jgi:hypothetical protein
MPFTKSGIVILVFQTACRIFNLEASVFRGVGRISPQIRRAVIIFPQTKGVERISAQIQMSNLLKRQVVLFDFLTVLIFIVQYGL